MEASEPFISQLCGGSRYADQTLVCHTLLHPESTLLSLQAGEVDDVAAGMLLTATALPAEEGARLDRWFSREMTRLNHLAGGQADAAPKK